MLTVKELITFLLTLPDWCEVVVYDPESDEIMSFDIEDNLVLDDSRLRVRVRE